MKRQCFNNLLAIVCCAFLLTNCDNNGYPNFDVPPAEHIDGFVQDEQGNPLGGIRVEAFIDEQLKERFEEIGFLDEEGKFIIEEDMYLYTDSKGYYCFGRASTWNRHQAEQHKELYIVVTDTSGFFAPKTQKGIIVYSEAGVGEGRLDFTLQKSTDKGV